MKSLIAIVLLAIFAVVLCGVLQQREDLKRQERERAEQVLRECWQTGAASVCGDLAKQLEGSH